MDADLLEIRDYEGEGYQPLIAYGDWRVAVLRYQQDLNPDQITSMERHTKTDEVFILLRGSGILFLGGNHPEVDGIHPQVMEIGKIYNVKCNAWHTVALSPDAKILLVENRDTDTDNSEYTKLASEWLKAIRDFANQQRHT